jgi:hypothetical protein
MMKVVGWDENIVLTVLSHLFLISFNTLLLTLGVHQHHHHDFFYLFEREREKERESEKYLTEIS